MLSFACEFYWNAYYHRRSVKRRTCLKMRHRTQIYHIVIKLPLITVVRLVTLSELTIWPNTTISIYFSYNSIELDCQFISCGSTLRKSAIINSIIKNVRFMLQNLGWRGWSKLIVCHSPHYEFSPACVHNCGEKWDSMKYNNVTELMRFRSHSSHHFMRNQKSSGVISGMNNANGA